MTAGKRFVIAGWLVAAAMCSQKAVPLVAQAPASDAPSISVQMNPPSPDGGPGTPSITWTTGDGSDGVVYVSRDGEPERLLGRAAAGSAAAPWVRPTSAYEIRLYTPSEPRRLLATASIRGAADAGREPTGTSAPFLRATPNPVLDSRTTIEWDAGPHPGGHVDVSDGGSPPRLLGEGHRGSLAIDWIMRAETYQFRLLADDSTTPLATILVARDRPAESWGRGAGWLAVLGSTLALGLIASVILRSAPLVMPLLDGGPRLLISIAGLWIVTAILINPLGEFPVQDDWAYAWSVKTLIDGGGFQLSDWAAVNLLPQVLWGWLFSLPGHFSFTALRFSTLLAALAALLVVARLLMEMEVRTSLVLACVLVIALNPIYLVLSHSFMSDVPSFALFVGAFYAIARGLQGSRHAMQLGWALSLVAVLERQSNFVLLPALAAATLSASRITWRTVARSSLPVIAGILVQLGFARWLAATGRQPLLHNLQIDKLLETLTAGPGTIASVYGSNVFAMAIYLGLFLFPVLAIVYTMHLNALTPGRRLRSACGVAIVVAAGLWYLGDSQMPLKMARVGNYLDRAGIGPPQVGGYYAVLGATGEMIVGDVWAVLTVLALAGAAILGGAIARVLRTFVHPPRELAHWRPLVVFAAVALLFLVLGVGGVPPDAWFDRYLLPFLPVCAVLVVLSVPRDRPASIGATPAAVCVATLVLFGVFGVAASHDYIASNRARWAAFHEVMDAYDATPHDIDAWEVAGWYFGQRIESCHPGYDRARTQRPDWGDFTCLHNHRERPYVASSEPLPYDVAGSKPFARWLPPMTETVFVLRRPR